MDYTFNDLILSNGTYIGHKTLIGGYSYYQYTIYGNTPSVTAKTGGNTITGNSSGGYYALTNHPSFFPISGSPTIINNGNDSIYGTKANDIINGGWGNDLIFGGDNTNSGDPFDSISTTVFKPVTKDYGHNGSAGTNGRNITVQIDYDGDGNYKGTGDIIPDITNFSRADYLFGGEGNDTIDSGNGSDLLFGGNGDDLLFSGAYQTSGTTDLIGGNGADTFVLGNAPSALLSTSGGINWGNLAWSIAGDVSDLIFTMYGFTGPKGAKEGATTKIAKETIPAIIDTIKAIANGKTISVVEPADTASYMEVKDFDPREDVMIIPLASDGDPDVFFNNGSNGSGRGITFNRDSAKNGSVDTFALATIKSSFTPTARAAISEQTINNALIVGPNGVIAGGAQQSQTGFSLNSLLGTEQTNKLTSLGNKFLILGAYGSQTLYPITYNNVYGSKFSDVIYGYTPEEVIKKSEGELFAPGINKDSQLFGYGGNDILNGGGGNDTLDGGSGSDTASYIDASNGVNIDLTKATVSDGFGGQDKLISIENIIGSVNNDTLTGNNQDNILRGSKGNDILNGQNGYDTLKGEEGNDSLNGGPGRDVLIGGPGNDSLRGGNSSSTGYFSSMSTTRGKFTYNSQPKWETFGSKPRQLGDVNGDGRADIVGFTSDGTHVALAQQDGTFGNSFKASDNYSHTWGWNNYDQFPRQVGDVNGDGRVDVVGFAWGRVITEFGQTNGTFSNGVTSSREFGQGVNGWTSFNSMPWDLADVNGDNKEDLVVFKNDGTYVALSQNDGTFASNFKATNNFDHNRGWSNYDQYPRQVGDVNGDGRADVVGFGGGRVIVEFGQANGTFRNEVSSSYDFGQGVNGWTSFNSMPWHLADVNGDNKDDLVVFKNDGIYLGLAQDDGTFASASKVYSEFGSGYGWSTFDQFPRQVGDVNGDGKDDITGFGYSTVYTLPSAFERDIFVFDSTEGVDTIYDFDASKGDAIQIDTSVFGISSGSISNVSYNSSTNALSFNNHHLATLDNPTNFDPTNANHFLFV